jgi:ataxin-3
MPNPLVYWEKQDSDQLCGLHCLNSLLQGPIFTEFDLAEIGMELDQRERLLLDDVSAQAGVQTNVNDSGNFTFQVLVEAMSRINQGFAFIPIRHSDVSGPALDKLLAGCSGFVCHNSNHWIAIRRVGEEWYNLNSTNTRAPQLISEFLLSLFFESVQQGGYLIFGIQGDFPEYSPKDFQDNLRPHQRFLTADFIRECCESDKKRGKFKFNIGSGEQEAIDEAMEESLRMWQESEDKRLGQERENLGQALTKQIKSFQGHGLDIGGTENSTKRCGLIRF